MGIHFLETASFLDFARFVCALREHPLRVYGHALRGESVLAARVVLSESILSFYTRSDGGGRYVSYEAGGGREKASVTSSVGSTAKHAPIVHLETLPFPARPPKRHRDRFRTARVRDLESLARLTYDPDLPDEPDVTLLGFPRGRGWAVGYVTSLELDRATYVFNYVELGERPAEPFLQYSGHMGGPAKFTGTFRHGYPYLPVVMLRRGHPVFGL